jgi:histidinol phosphatase-like PHP family hydrolase
MKIDLHIHSNDRSMCGTANDDQMVRAAIEHGLDAIAFTDHNRLVPPNRIAQLDRKFAPFKIFGGIEVSIADEHVIVLGVHDPEIEKGDWEYPDLYNFVKQRDGVVIIAHPYRWSGDITIDLKKYPPHAIEINSSNMGLCDAEKIEKLIEDLGCHRIINSDAHAPELVGIFYNQLNTTPTTEKQLLDLIKSGSYKYHRSEHRIQNLNTLGYNLR